MAPDQASTESNLSADTSKIDTDTNVSTTGTTEYDNLDQRGEDVDRGIVVDARDVPDGLPAPKKKKKRSKKPASKRGLGKPTGFEEFHADAPLTPEQYLESKKTFHPDVPFVDRILKAIQRFERTRKLSPERRDIFYKYLAYGGVEVGPNMFVGAQDTKDMDKDQVSSALAQANISDEAKQEILDPKREANQAIHTEECTGEGSKTRSAEHQASYVVDFEGTMRGFLSRHIASIYAFDTFNSVELITTTLERFMDYLLLHEVCPEYATEVLRTRDLCRASKSELWDCVEAQRNLPGSFNVACSTLFGGSYGQNYDGETYWGPENTGENVFVGLKPEQATQIIGFAIAGAASEEVYTKYLEITQGESAGRDFEIVNVIRDHGFEITKIELPTEECLQLYAENTTEFRAVGRVYAKFFKNPQAPPEDMSPAEEASFDWYNSRNEDEPFVDEDKEYVFFIEAKPLLTLLRLGMRVQATIHQLECGVWFFDEVTRVIPSFDLWLENELMIGWKEPKPLSDIPKSIWNVGVTSDKEDAATERQNSDDGLGIDAIADSQPLDTSVREAIPDTHDNMPDTMTNQP